MKRILLLLAIILSSCTEKKPSTYEGVGLTIPYKIVFKSTLDYKKSAIVENCIEETFKDFNNILNHWNEKSEISLFNKSDSTELMQVSPLLYELFCVSKRAHSQTKGKFDPTYGKVIALWKTHLKLEKLPDQEEVEALVACCGMEKLIMQNGYVQKSHKDCYIDFDGIIKGFFCDTLAKRFLEIGVKNFLIEWGGEVLANGGPFSIYCKNKIITLKNSCVATSGHTYQIFPIIHKDLITFYSHILDPKTHSPLKVNDLNVCESSFDKSCALADAKATSKLIP